MHGRVDNVPLGLTGRCGTAAPATALLERWSGLNAGLGRGLVDREPLGDRRELEASIGAAELLLEKVEMPAGGQIGHIGLGGHPLEVHVALEEIRLA